MVDLGGRCCWRGSESPAAGQSAVDQTSLAQVAGPIDSMLNDVGIDQRLGAQVPLELEFRDEKGQTVRLADLMHGRPVVLSLVYYRCPMLCGEVLNGLLKSSQAVQFVIGKDYDVLTVSFDPEETPALAAEKKAAFVSRYRRPGAEQGWHFLVGDAPRSSNWPQSVGFRYRYDEHRKSVRSWGGHCRFDARGTGFAIFLRHRLSADRFAVGIGRKCGGQDRFAGRSVFAALFSLRSGDGPVWAGDFAADQVAAAAQRCWRWVRFCW